MGIRYCVLGAGRQGTAAAYDLARFGNPDDLALADVEISRADASAARVNALIDSTVAQALHVDVSQKEALPGLLEPYDVIVSAVPYTLNQAIATAAVDAGTSMVDLGGNTAIVRSELAMDEQARNSGISVIPDCGMGPGMNVSLLVHAMDLLEEPQAAMVYDGGLPESPQPPWNYALTFNIQGLTNEYTGEAPFLRGGEVVFVPALTEPEVVEIPPLGALEARVTAGGLSTAPWSFQGTLQTLENKTLRYPGHWDKIVAFRDLGLFSRNPVEVDGQAVIPRHLFHALFEPQIAVQTARDVAIIRVRARGRRGGEPFDVVVDMVDRYDDATKFTAMERVTGWHAALVAQMIASGEIPPGAHPIESVSGRRVVEEAARRGLHVVESMSHV